MNDITAIGISFQIGLDTQRNLVFQTHVPYDISEEALNSLIDRLAKASDRKIAFYEIKKIESELEMMEKQYRQLLEDLERVDISHKEAYDKSNTRGPFKLSDNQKKERQNVLISKARHEDEINLRKEKIERLSNALAGAANSNTVMPNS